MRASIILHLVESNKFCQRIFEEIEKVKDNRKLGKLATGIREMRIMLNIRYTAQ